MARNTDRNIERNIQRNAERNLDRNIERNIERNAGRSAGLDAETGHDPAELGELERGILSIVWRLGSVTADRVREELDRPLKDSTVRTVLRRLEEKGYLAHSVEQRTFVYRPAESRQHVAGRAARRIVDWFCEGSVEALLVGMVDSKMLEGAELQRLAARIAEAEKTSHSGPGKNRRKIDREVEP